MVKDKGPPDTITTRSITKTWHKLIYAAKIGHYLKLSREGKAVIGWQDETFVHLSLNTMMGWVPQVGGCRNQNPSKGRLLSVSHVLTPTGLLQGYDKDGKRHEPALNDPWTTFPTAEQIIQPADGKADYHDFPGGTFPAMVERRIYAAAVEAHPECFGENATAVFVLHIDNAPQHHSPGKQPQLPKPKKDIIDFMVARGVTESWHWKRRANGLWIKQRVLFNDALRKNKSIDIKDLRAAAFNWASEHAPEYLMCEAEAFAKEKGFVILWGVPNEPNWNPIEMVWSILKAYVALKYKEGRTQSELLAQIREALYSTAYAAEGHSKVKGGGFLVLPGFETCPLAERLIRHSLDCIDKWIAEECPTATPGEGETEGPWLSGSVQGELFVHPDLKAVADALQTRKQLLAWIAERVRDDAPEHIDYEGVEADATEETPE